MNMVLMKIIIAQFLLVHLYKEDLKWNVRWKIYLELRELCNYRVENAEKCGKGIF